MQAIAALAGCAAAAIIAVRSWQSRKPLLFAIAFFFVTLSPTSNLVILIGAIMGERLLYLPSVGFAVAVVWAFDSLRRRASESRPAVRYVAGAGLSVLLMGCAARTYDRNGDWLEPERFWLSAAAAAPGSYKTNMGAATSTLFATEEDVTRSIHYADRALAILEGLPDSENSPGGYQDAGILYRRLGDRSAPDGAALSCTGNR